MFLEYIPMEEQDADILTKALSCKSSFIETGLGYLIIPFLLRGSVENGNKKILI